MASNEFDELSANTLQAAKGRLGQNAFSPLPQIAQPLVGPWGGQSCLYVAGSPTAIGGGIALAVDRLWASPFVPGRKGVIGTLALNQTVVSGAGGLFNMALYDSDPLLLFPRNLLGQGAQQAADGALGLKSFPVSIPVDIDRLLWAVYWAGAAAAPSVNIQNAMTAPVFGYNSSLSLNSGLSSLLTYSPNNFPVLYPMVPGGTTIFWSTGPCLFYSYSS